MILLAACRLDDGDSPTLVKATAVSGQDMVLNIGYARVEIGRNAIGTGAGQLAPGSIVSLTATGNFVENAHVYSPVLRVHVSDAAGVDVSGLSLSPPAAVFLRYDLDAAGRDGNAVENLLVLKKTGAATTTFIYSATLPVTDSQFTNPEPGWTLVHVTSFSDFAVTDGGSGEPAPEPVDLDGTVSTVLGFTVFELENAGQTIEANLAVPTSLTTTVPTVQALNDASYDATNPSGATNRILTVATGGVDYTTDAPGAGVTLSLDTFSGVNSSGTLVGVLVEDGGTDTLNINYEFTTDSAGAITLAGAVTDLGGRRTIQLSDSGQTISVAIIMPDTLPAAPFPDTINFDAASFNAATPLDPSGRLITVSQGGTNYTSDVASPAADVDVTFASFASGVSSGGITGTVVSDSGAPLVINFTFTTVAANGGGGGGTFTNDAPVYVDTDPAVESAVVFDGTNFVALWLSDVGTTNRTIEIQQVTTAGVESGAQVSVEPTAALQGSGGMAAAISPTDVLVVVGATGSNPATSTVVALVVDYTTPSLVQQHTIGNGTFPRVVWNNAGTGQFVIAYTTGTGVSLNTLDATGATLSSASAFLPGAILGGLASGGAADEVLISGPDGTGVRAQLVVATTAAASGSAFDISTTLGGGLCAFDIVSGRYLVLAEQQNGFVVSPLLRQLPVGGSTLDAQSIVLVGFEALTQAATGDNAVMLCDPSSDFHAVVGDTTTGPEQIGSAIIGAYSGIDLDTSSDGPALASDGAGHFLAACARGAGGFSVIRFTVTP
ncbi:MAG: hypothetical protein IT462_06005 [Planctomycetes bacterium]|nr:hypothetical protein [Planctomycetota bacterium]